MNSTRSHQRGYELSSPKARPYSYDDLIACGHGTIFGAGNARLPLPPMLMFDRITQVSAEGGAHEKGFIKAEFDIKPDLWFFQCHFESDPVMPGCLGLDALRGNWSGFISAGPVRRSSGSRARPR